MSEIECIKDAGLFRIGELPKFHKVQRIEGVRVSAECGAYAYADYFNTYPDGWTGQDYDTRPASWASGYTGVGCPRCGADRL